MNTYNITLTYQDKMILSGTIFSHPPRDSLKSIKLRDFLLKIGYFNIPLTTQNTTLCYEDRHIRSLKLAISQTLDFNWLKAV